MSECKICNGSKHIYKENHGWVACECLENIRLKNFFIDTNVPKAYEDIAWDSYSEKFPSNKSMIPVMKKIRDILISDNSNPTWLALVGPQETGKLGLVSLIIKDLYFNGFSCSIETLYSLVNLSFTEGGMDEIYQIANKDFLCLRLGVSNKHKQNPTILDYIIDIRRRKNKYTIFTMRRGMSWFDRFFDNPQLYNRFNKLVKIARINKQ